MYLVNADERKYGSVVKGLNSQKALKNDQFPKSIIEGNNVLSTHRFDNANRSSQNSRSHPRDRQERNDAGPTLNFVQLEGKCYCCGKPGHKSPQCFMKDKTKREEWAIKKIQMTQLNNKESNESTTTPPAENDKK